MLFKDLLRDELLQAANFYKIDFGRDDTKAELSTALLDAGKTPEQWAKDKEEYVNGGEADFRSDEEEEEVVEESRTAEPEEEEEVDEVVLVRFTGNNQSYRNGKTVFTKEKPFALMKESVLQGLDPDRFRVATKREAREFYGR